MEIPKSYVLLVFTLLFCKQQILSSGIKPNFIEKIVIDGDRLLYLNQNSNFSQPNFDKPEPPNSNARRFVSVSSNNLDYITTSAGDQSTVNICEGEHLTISSTYDTNQAEFEFHLIRGSNDTIIKSRSATLSLELTSNEIKDGDIYYIKIFDSNNFQQFNSSLVTVKVLSLPNGETDLIGGTVIQEDQIICYAYIPKTLTVTGDNSSTDFLFQWELSTDNGATYTEITGATNPFLIFTSGVTRTTTYRRSKRWSKGGTCFKYTNEHRITPFEVDAGAISSGTNTYKICNGEIPPIIESQTLAPINVGSLSYNWQISTDGMNWTNTGSTSINYQHPETLTTTTYFRRKAIQIKNEQTCSSYSNIVTITVLDEIHVGTLSGTQKVCEGYLPTDPIVYNSELDPQLIYQWLFSADGQTYTNINGQNQKELTFNYGDTHLPNEIGYYKLKITQDIGGIGCIAETDSLTIIELPLKTTITTNAPNNTICEGGNVTITAQGSNTFQFIVDGFIRSDATDNQLTLEGLTQTTTVTIRASNDGCEKLHSIVINVIKIDPGTIDLSVDDCSDTSSFKLLSTASGTLNGEEISPATGGNYLWQSSSDGINWLNIAGANQHTLQVGNTYRYTPPSYFRRLIQYQLFGLDCQKFSNSIYLENQPSLDGGVISIDQQSVCGNTTPTTTTLSVKEATQGNHVKYQWEESTDDGVTYSEITGATSITLELKAVTQKTLYRRKIAWVGDDSCPQYSSVHTIVYLQNNPGSITTSIPTICYDQIPPLIESQNPATINTGQLTYDWEYSLDNQNWNSIGENSDRFQPTQTRTQTHYYRRKSIQTENGKTCSSYSNTVTITVADQIINGIISGSQKIGYGTVPQPLQFEQSLNPDYTYQWIYSTDGLNYTAINGQTDKTLNFSAGGAYTPSKTSYYKMAISSNKYGTNCTVLTSSVTIEISNPTIILTDPFNRQLCTGETISITASGTENYLFYVDGVQQIGVASKVLTLENLTKSVTVTVKVVGFPESHNVSVTVHKIDAGEITYDFEHCDETKTLQFKSVVESSDNGIPFSISADGIYSWETSSDGIHWSTVSGSNQPDFELSNPGFPVFVRRNSQNSNLSSNCLKSSNVIEVQTFPTLKAGKVSPFELLVCSGNVSTVIHIIDGTVGNDVSYQWEVSKDNGLTFSSLDSQTSASLALSNATESVQYRRKVSWKIDNSCPKTSDIFNLIVLENDPGAIKTGIVSICYGSSPPEINSISPASVNGGTLSYQWEFSTDGEKWNNALGQTSENFSTTSTLTQTHYYRRKSIQNLNGKICENYTKNYTVIVFDEIQKGGVSGTQDICLGEKINSPITYELPLNPSLTYQWMFSTDGVNFFTIPGEQGSILPIHTNVSFTPTQTTHYRMAISNNESALNCVTTYTNTATVYFIDDFGLSHDRDSNKICKESTITFFAKGDGLFSFYLNGILVQGPSLETSFTITNPEGDIEITLINEHLGTCSNIATLTLSYEEVYAGKISGPENICNNTKNIILKSTQNANVNGEPLSGNGFSYQWQSSLDGNSFTDILNATTEEYTISLLTTDTHFRRIVKTQSSESECIKSSNVIKLGLNDLSSEPSSIEISTSLCNEGVYASYSGGVPPYKGELFDINHNLIGSGSTNDNQSFGNLLPGRFYTLRVTDNSCYQPKEIIFEVPLEIKFDPHKVTIEHDLCREQSTDIGQGSIRLAADAFTGGSNAFDFSWSGPNFTGQGSEINGLLPGTYLLTATDKLLGCTQTESIVVLGKDPLVLSLKASNLSLRSDGVYQLGCQSGSNPSIEVNVSGGHGQYTYSWKKDGLLLSGNQTKLITPVTAGVYQVTVTDIPPTGIDVDNPCQEIVYFNVQSDIPLAIQVDRTALGVTLCENNKIQIPVKISGGIPPYTLTIQGHGSISTGQNSYTFNNIDPKKLGSNLNVNVTDQVGCSASAPSIPIESPSQYTFISSNTNIDCLKGTLGTIQLSLDQPLGEIETFHLEWKGDTVHYFDTWENGNGLLKNLNNPGTYTVTVTNSHGCIVHTESFKIEDLSKSKLAVKIAEQIANSHCDSANGAIQLEINGGYPPYSIDWQQLSQTNSWTTLPVFENHALISGLSSGTFRAIVGDASSEYNVDRCSEKITTREIIIQQKNVKIVQFTASNAADLCNSNGSGKISFQIQNTLTSTGTTSMTYQIDGANISANDINNQGNQIEIKGISPGSHQLKVQIKSGSSNCTISQDFSIEDPLAPITFTGQRTYESSLCNEATKIIIKTEEISGGSPFELEPPYALEWHYQPLNENTDTVSHTRYGWEINNALPGSYELIISDAYGCQNDPSAPIIIKVEPPQIETISVKGILKSNSDEIVKALPVQCENDNKGTIGIKIEGGVRPLEIRWFFLQPDGVVNDSSTNGPTHLPIHDNQTFLNGLSAGVYRLEINGESAMCKNGTSPYIFYTEDIEVKPNPSLHLVSGPFIEGNLCEGKPGRITVEVFDNNQDGLYFYYDGKVLQEEEYEQINNQTHTLIIENPVEEGVLEILNAQGCSIKHSINLKLGDPDFSFTSASYEITKNILTKEEITFRNNSTNPYVKSEWIFGDFSQPVILSHTASSSTVKHTFLKSGVFPVTLRIYNANGCSREVKHMLSVGKGYSISLPNVFSPNNDGINDQFRPIISGFKEVEFNVFDPRGNLLYHEKMEEPNPNHAEGLELKGWDANNATQALYFIYSLSGILFDETEIDKSGTFILLK